MPFSNPVVGGETLIRNSIQSEDYVPGVSGWAIFRNGNAEFLNIVARGSFHAENAASGSFVDVDPGTTDVTILINPPDSANVGVTFTPAALFAAIVNPATDSTQLSLTSPNIATPAFHDNAQIILLSRDIADSASQVQLIADQVVAGRSGGPFNDIGRGMVAYAGDTANSAAIGNVETAVLTTPVTTFQANRAFRCKLAGRTTVSVAPNAPLYMIRKTNPAGQGLVTIGRDNHASAQEFAIMNGDYVFTVGAADIAAAVCFTMLGSAAFTVSHQARRWLAIYDVGPASKYPDAVVMV